MGADPEHKSFAVAIEQPQLAQCCGYVFGDDDPVDGFGERRPPAAQIEGRVGPIADDALVDADAALPPDRRHRIGASGSVCSTIIRPSAAARRSAVARQRAFQGDTGIAWLAGRASSATHRIARVRTSTLTLGRVCFRPDEPVRRGGRNTR